MITFKQHLNEALRILPDEKIDSFVSSEWSSVVTYPYHSIASMELAKVLPDVIITKDKKWMHIPGALDTKMNKAVNRIEKEYGIKMLDESQQLEILEEGLKDILSSIKSKIKLLKELPKLSSIKGMDIENPESSFDKIGKEIGADKNAIQNAKNAVKEFKKDSVIGKITTSSISTALAATMGSITTLVIKEVPALQSVLKSSPTTITIGIGLVLLITFLTTLYSVYKD